MTLSVDIMADIIKVGEPKLKTTLFAINKTAKALGLDYQSLKVAPQDELKLKTPFIAHFKNEHFVTVQKAEGGKVYYTDLDYPRIVDQQDFLKNVDGFVFALLVRKEDVTAHGYGVDASGLRYSVVMDRQLSSRHSGLPLKPLTCGSTQNSEGVHA